MNDAERGLYRKYKVERNDGSSGPGGKHEKCEYFILDLEHDKHAKAALKAYADSPAQKEWYKTYLPIREESTTFDITN